MSSSSFVTEEIVLLLLEFADETGVLLEVSIKSLVVSPVVLFVELSSSKTTVSVEVDDKLLELVSATLLQPTTKKQIQIISKSDKIFSFSKLLL